MPWHWRASDLLAVLAAAWCVPALAQEAPKTTSIDPAQLNAHVREASALFGLPEAWIHAVIRQESRGNPKAISRAGAMGLMQLMPRTWQRQRARFALGHDPFEPRDNVLAGTSYLREMYDSFGMPGFLAAYNAGPGRYLQWRNNGRALPAETRSYVATIAAAMGRGVSTPLQPLSNRSVSSWTNSALFPGQLPGEFLRSPENPSDAHGAGPNEPPARHNPLFADILEQERP